MAVTYFMMDTFVPISSKEIKQRKKRKAKANYFHLSVVRFWPATYSIVNVFFILASAFSITIIDQAL